MQQILFCAEAQHMTIVAFFSFLGYVLFTDMVSDLGRCSDRAINIAEALWSEIN